MFLLLAAEKVMIVSKLKIYIWTKYFGILFCITYMGVLRPSLLIRVYRFYDTLDQKAKYETVPSNV